MEIYKTESAIGCVSLRHKVHTVTYNKYSYHVQKKLTLLEHIYIYIYITLVYIYIYIFNGFGGLGVACWPLVPKFAGSNPAEAVGFLRAKKSSARLPSEGK